MRKLCKKTILKQNIYDNLDKIRKISSKIEKIYEYMFFWINFQIMSMDQMQTEDLITKSKG